MFNYSLKVEIIVWIELLSLTENDSFSNIMAVVRCGTDKMLDVKLMKIYCKSTLVHVYEYDCKCWLQRSIRQMWHE